MKSLKNNKESIKNIVIAIIITANLAFIAGMKYQTNQTNSTKAEVQKQVQVLKAELER